jgi:hypothetical protein
MGEEMTTTTSEMIAQMGIGHLVWWDLSKATITPGDLRMVYAAEGADPSVIPEIDPISAIRTTARGWTQGRGNADRYRAEVVAEEEIPGLRTVTVGILKRVRVGRGEVRWEQVESATFSEMTAAWAVHTGTPDLMGLFVRDADIARTHYDDAWIRPNVIQNTLKDLKSFLLKKGGGIYWTPESGAEVLDRLQRIVGKIGSSSLTVLTPDGTSAATKAQIGQGARNALLEDMTEVREKIAGWSDRSRKCPDSYVETLIAEAGDLTDRAELYAASLEIAVDEILADIASMRDNARALLELPEEKVSTPRSEGGSPSAGTVSRGRTVAKHAANIAGWVQTARAAYGDEVTGAQMEESGMPRWFCSDRNLWNLATPILRAEGLTALMKIQKTEAGLIRTLRIGDVGPDKGIPETPAEVVDQVRETYRENPEAPIAEIPTEGEGVESEEDGEEMEIEEESGMSADVEIEEDRIANLRERLAEKSVRTLHEDYERLTGNAADHDLRKADLIEEIIGEMS